MSKRLIAVMSEPRSGSSMTMHILETVFGEERIRKGYNAWSSLLESATEAQLEQFNSFNRLGYFECEETFNGIKELPEDLLGGLNFFKLMIRNIGDSDLSLIRKSIIVIRNPLATVVSQKELSDFFDSINGTELDPYDLFLDAYIENMEYLKGLLVSGKINYCLFDYDEICASPETELSRMQDFIGEGDFSSALTIPKQIEQDVSQIENHSSPLIQPALDIYNEIKSKYIGSDGPNDMYVI